MTDTTDETDYDAAVLRLSGMPPHEYDRVRKAEAKRLDVQVSTLNRAVAEAREAAARRTDEDDAPAGPVDALTVASITARLAALPEYEYQRTRKAEAKKLGFDQVSVLDKMVKDARAGAGKAKVNGTHRTNWDGAWRGSDHEAFGGSEATQDDRPDTQALDGFDLNEDGVALAFTNKYRDRLRYDHHIGAWFRWDGSLWRREETKLAFSWARAVCRQLACEADAGDKLKSILAKAATAASVERFAQSDRAHAVTSETWDRDTLLLGTPNGTVDLRTGELREPRSDDFITKSVAVAPSQSEDCPTWLKFLNEATKNDKELIRFIQQFCGYMLTGEVTEHALLFIYGTGGNGKSVFLNVVSGILNDYAKVAPMDALMASQSDKHPTELAMLKGARLVSANETEEGRPWAEARIKQLTGGDRITARFMRQDFFEYTPQFKLMVIGNYKPVLRNVDEASRRRINVVPFIHKPANPDKELGKKLQAELPGILRWMIVGCLDWQKNGLIRPKAVLDATREYFDEQDLVHQWIEDRCEVSPAFFATKAELFKGWTDYALASGEKPGTGKWFSQVLLRQGYTPLKNTPGAHGQRGFSGIKVKNVDTSRQWQNRAEGDGPGAEEDIRDPDEPPF